MDVTWGPNPSGGGQLDSFAVNDGCVAAWYNQRCNYTDGGADGVMTVNDAACFGMYGCSAPVTEYLGFQGDFSPEPVPTMLFVDNYSR